MVRGIFNSGAGRPEVSYGPSSDAWASFKSTAQRTIMESGARTVVEIGGGAHPLFTPDEVQAMGVQYTVLDIAQTELDRAPSGYNTVLADIASGTADIPSAEFDFAFSRMVAEHVSDGETMHRNVFNMLSPGGRALHFFPTLFALPFVVNRAIPERQAKWLLAKLTPSRDVHVSKFPARYSWCFGPTQRQIGRLSAIGFQVERYQGFFGHGTYYARLSPIRRLHELKSTLLLRRPKPILTSFAQVLLQKPPS